MSQPRFQVRGAIDGEQWLFDTKTNEEIFHDGSMESEDTYLFRDLGDWVDRLNVLAAESDALREDSKMLAALQAGGVDNWEGYDSALEAIGK